MDGIIVINKPKECTSHDVVYQIKKIVKEKVGHTGTLDPMATGVLPLLIGKGTLCSKYLINHNKTYEVKLQLGKRTDTADLEGNVVEEKTVEDFMLEEENIKNILNSFLGKQEQIPPIYSAIKVNGKKLYEYARKGQKVEIKPRNIEIYEIELIKIHKNDKQIEFKVSCSKGTYIRSLCEDIAKKIGTVGYMCELNRTKVGEFSIEQAITMEEFKKANKENFPIITIEKLFQENKSINLEKQKLNLLLNGVKLKRKEEDGIYRIYNDQKFIGIGIIKDQFLKRDIII